MAEAQTIPGRHGTATFVPAGRTIKIINTSGTQVVDTWAFALPKPLPKQEEGKDGEAKKVDQDEKENTLPEKEETPAKPSPTTPAKQKKPEKGGLPSQEEAEQATQQGLSQADDANKETQNETPQKSTWGSYVPSIGWSSKKNQEDGGAQPSQQSAEQQQNSKTWASYMPSGKGFGSYVPKSATDTVSQFASTHQRDPNKSYVEQLQQFSKTPVGAAGMAALTGSGYSGTMWAGYQAWNATSGPDDNPMEFLSMAHSRSATYHLRPRVNDTLVTNLRAPILTLIEDTSPGVHDTLIAACDPQRYRELGVEKWEEHGSCAENLVLALKELNERAGLTGARAVGATVTINSVPAPLNLFMNIPWDDNGELGSKPPKCKAGDYVRLRAERDTVVVMSACPQDVSDINAKNPTDAHFLVEGSDEQQQQQQKQKQQKKRPPLRKVASSRQAPATANANSTTQAGAPAKKPVPQRRTVPQRKQSVQTSQSEQTLPSQKKKPVPKLGQKKATGGETPVNGAGEGNEEGAEKKPVERKKPRKLAPKTG